MGGELKVEAVLYAAAIEEYLKQGRRQLAVERIGRLIGSAPDVDEALDEIERERRSSGRDVA